MGQCVRPQTKGKGTAVRDQRALKYAPRNKSPFYIHLNGFNYSAKAPTCTEYQLELRGDWISILHYADHSHYPSQIQYR